MLTSDEALAHLLEGIEDEARRRYGRLKTIERERLGKHPGALSHVYRGRHASSLAKLSQLLEDLGVDLDTFYGAHLGYHPDASSTLRRLERLHRVEKLPEWLCGLRERRRKTVQHAQPSDKRREDEDRPRPRESAASFLSRPIEQQLVLFEALPEFQQTEFAAELLQALEAHRYRRPAEAGQLAEKVVLAALEPPLGADLGRHLLYCRGLAVVASCYRQLGRLRAANRALREGLACARLWGLDDELPGLLRRAGYLLVDYGEPIRALELVQLVSLLHFERLELEKIGELMVDRGIILNLLEEPARAIAIFNEATRLLLPSEARHFAAAHLGLGNAYQMLGDHDAAEVSYQRAEELIAEDEPICKANLLLCRGDLAACRERFARAESFYRRVLELADDLSIDDVAIATLHLARALLAQGKAEATISLAEEMRAVLKPLRRNKVAHATFSAFLQAAKAGELSLAYVEGARRTLRRALRSPRSPGLG